MLTAYKYTYIRIYQWYLKMFGKSDVPEYSAAIVLSMNFCLNIGSIASIVYIIFNVRMLAEGLSKAAIIVPFLLVFLLHYLAFIYKGKYQELEKEFMKESDLKRKRKATWVLLYTIGSPVLFILLLFFGIWVKS